MGLVLNKNRKNTIGITITDEGAVYDLTNCTLHFSVFSGDTEMFHISQASHANAAGGLSEIAISTVNAAKLSEDGRYRYELSLHDATGDDWGLEDGYLEAVKYTGALA